MNDKNPSVITDEEFIRARPWPCCKDALLVGRNRELIPLVALCDKKAGHSGKHRGRLNGSTYYWRTLGAQEIAKKRRVRREYLEKEQRRLDAQPEMIEMSRLSFGWLEWLLDLIGRVRPWKA